tara:strand:- start:542 stop:1015 length:474 start_codon:yes stop_codon:yes gene_type:complete
VNPPEPSGVQLRFATPDDAVTLADLDRRAGPWPWPAAHYQVPCRGTDPAQGRVLLLEGATGPLAAVVYSRVLELGEIQNVISDPGHRRLGLARHLLSEVLAQLRIEGAERCLLEVRASNGPAIALYRRCGFVVDGRRRNYYPLGSGREDALLMSLPL